MGNRHSRNAVPISTRQGRLGRDGGGGGGVLMVGGGGGGGH